MRGQKIGNQRVAQAAQLLLAVRRGAPNTFVLGCMPYQSYNTVDRALANATRFMQESLCDAVKPQGGKSQAHILKALVDAGIPTASHIGLTPQSINVIGSFRAQGREEADWARIEQDALAVAEAEAAQALAPAEQRDISSAQAAYNAAATRYNELRKGPSASDIAEAMRNWNTATKLADVGRRPAAGPGAGRI